MPIIWGTEHRDAKHWYEDRVYIINADEDSLEKRILKDLVWSYGRRVELLKPDVQILMAPFAGGLVTIEPKTVVARTGTWIEWTVRRDQYYQGGYHTMHSAKSAAAQMIVEALQSGEWPKKKPPFSDLSKRIDEARALWDRSSFNPKNFFRLA